MPAETQLDSINNSPEISLADVQAAAARIAGYAHHTPVITCQTINQLAGAELYFKCEHLQKVGAFKFRGTCNAVAQLDPERRARGVVTHSSGNHAQALALAARLLGTTAHIVMPTSAPAIKRAAVVGYGGQVYDCEPNLTARESTAKRVLANTGGTLIHPYNDPQVIAGQGTAALELLADIDGLTTIVAPIGGGGLISGTCLVAKSQSPPLTVIAAEPAGADDAWRSKQAGKLIPQTDPDTIADGLLTSLGSWTWPFIKHSVDQIITVDDKEICGNLRLFWERTKQLIEPSAAVAVAAAIRHAKSNKLPKTEKIGVIISGGNVDLQHLAPRLFNAAGE